MIFRINHNILKLAGEPLSMYQVHQRSGISYKTVHRYLSGKPLVKVEMDVLYAILAEGLGLTGEQIAALTIGDLITIEG